MKKIIIVAIILFTLIFGSNGVKALEYQSTNLLESLEAENIELSYKKYKETDDQAIIYLFRGEGCPHCQDFLNFLNDNLAKYGKYFKVVSYEVWKNKTNSTLMNKVSEYLNEEASGVPFIVIGNKSFSGYGSSLNEEILDAIMDEYKNKNKNDVMKLMNINEVKSETCEEVKPNTLEVGILVLLIVVISTLVINHNINKKYILLNERFDDIEETIAKKINKN